MPSSFLSIITLFALSSLSAAAILRNADFGQRKRFLGNKTEEEKTSNDKSNVYYKERNQWVWIAGVNLRECFQVSAFIEAQTLAGSKLSSAELKSFATRKLKELMENPTLNFFFTVGEATNSTDLTAPEYKAHEVYEFLLGNHLFSKDCFNFAVALKNVALPIKKHVQELSKETKFTAKYKQYLFAWGVANEKNMLLSGKEGESSLISQLTVKLYRHESARPGSKIESAGNSGVLVNYDLKTGKFENVCESGKKEDFLNFLLTSVAGIEELRTQIDNRSKGKSSEGLSNTVFENGQSLSVQKHYSMVSVRQSLKLSNDKAQIAKFVQEGLLASSKDQSRDSAEIAQFTAGQKIAGKDVIIGRFDDENVILVQLATPFKVECSGSEFVDFASVNDRELYQKQVLEKAENNKYTYGLYGSTDFDSVCRVQIDTFLDDKKSLLENPVDETEVSHQSKPSTQKVFTLYGMINKGLVGGPLFLESQEKKTFVGVLSRMSITGVPAAKGFLPTPRVA